MDYELTFGVAEFSVKKCLVTRQTFLFVSFISFIMSNIAHPKSIEQLLVETSIKTLISENATRPIVSIPYTATISETIEVTCLFNA